MDLINYISQFHNFLRTEAERIGYANVLSILKDNKVIDEEYEDELFIILCIRKFIQDFKLITDNLNNEKVITYLKNKREHEYAQKQHANNNKSKIESVEPLDPKKTIEQKQEHKCNTDPKLIINCNNDNNNNYNSFAFI